MRNLSENFITIFLCVALFCVPPAWSSEEILLFAATSTAGAIDELLTLWPQRSQYQVVTAYAPSGTLARQIEMGAPAALFLSADPSWTKYLAQKIAYQRQAPVLGNSLVLIGLVAADMGPEQLLLQVLKSGGLITIADPDYVPLGRYSRSVLQGLGVWGRLRPELIMAASPQVVAHYVASGSCQLGISYASDVKLRPAIGLRVPLQLAAPITYQLMLLTKHPAAALLYDYLRTSPSAMAVFERHGFTAPSASTP